MEPEKISEAVEIYCGMRLEQQGKYDTLNGYARSVTPSPSNFMEKDLVLRKELLKLNAKKFVFTNGSHEHIVNITKHFKTSI